MDESQTKGDSGEGGISVKAEVKENFEPSQREAIHALHEPSHDSLSRYVPAAEASTAPEEWSDDQEDWDEEWADEEWEEVPANGWEEEFKEQEDFEEKDEGEE